MSEVWKGASQAEPLLSSIENDSRPVVLSRRRETVGYQVFNETKCMSFAAHYFAQPE
jgi:hypothetical protein